MDRDLPSAMLVAVLVGFFLLYLGIASLSRIPGLPLAIDGLSPFVVVHAAAERIANGQLLYRDHVRYGVSVYHYPPVFLYTLGAVYHLFGAGLLLGRAILVLSTVLSAAVLFGLVADRYDRRRAWLATGVFLVNPVTLVAVYAGYFDLFVVLLALLSIYVLHRGHPGMAGGLLALAVLSKPFPAILLPVATVFCFESDDPFLPRFLGTFLGVGLLVSAPFFLLAPVKYVYYAFLFNFERPTASLSLYYYFLPWFESTVVTVAAPAGFVAAYTYGASRPRIERATGLVAGPAVLFLGFLLLNRINYPHYLIYVVPFFAVVLADAYCSKLRVRGHLLWPPLVATFVLVLVGAAVWSVPWLRGVERVGLAEYAFKSSPYFWVGSGVYFSSAAALLIGLYAGLVEPT